MTSTAKTPYSDYRSHSWSPELTFIPRAAPHEIVCSKAGVKMIRRINDRLWDLKAGRDRLCVHAKLDPHHDPFNPKERTWCVEVTPYGGSRPFETEWLNDANPDHPLLRATLDHVFKVAKDEGLAPRVTRRRGDTLRYWPGGGCHIHYGSDLFNGGPHWYDMQARFHRYLYADYANNPWIRWLFSEWYADSGSKVILGKDDLKAKDHWTIDRLWDYTYAAHLTIEPRFMPTCKNTYATFEFRVFSMVEDTDEVLLLARFVHAWVMMIKGWIVHEAAPPPIVITRRSFSNYLRSSYMEKQVRNGLDRLGLKWTDYSRFYERHTLQRLKWGKLV